jgi:hypothetical protein
MNAIVIHCRKGSRTSKIGIMIFNVVGAIPRVRYKTNQKTQDYSQSKDSIFPSAVKHESQFKNPVISSLPNN